MVYLTWDEMLSRISQLFTGKRQGQEKEKVAPSCDIHGADGVSDGFCQKEMALCLDQI